MKKIVVLLVLLIAVLSPVLAKEGDISAGAVLGEPFGVTGRYDLGNQLSVDALVGYGVAGKNLDIRADVLYNYLEFAIEDVDLYPYAGGGIGLGFGSAFELGLKFPVGISYFITDPAIEVYAEVVPGLNFYPFGATFTGGVGGRYALDF